MNRILKIIAVVTWCVLSMAATFAVAYAVVYVLCKLLTWIL